MGISSINNDGINVRDDTGIQKSQDDLASSSAVKLEKLANVNKFLLLETEESEIAGTGKDRARKIPFDSPKEGSFSTDNVKAAVANYKAKGVTSGTSNTSETSGTSDAADTSGTFDIASIALTLIEFYLTQREDAEKLQKEEEENVVQKIKDEAQDIRSAADWALAAGIVEGFATGISGLCSFGGGLKGTDGSIVIGKGLGEMSEGIGKIASSIVERQAKEFEAKEKEDEAIEKMHENKAEEAKRQYQNMQDALNRTMQIMIETSKAQQETQKEIIRRA